MSGSASCVRTAGQHERAELPLRVRAQPRRSVRHVALGRAARQVEVALQCLDHLVEVLRWRVDLGAADARAQCESVGDSSPAAPPHSSGDAALLHQHGALPDATSTSHACSQVWARPAVSRTRRRESWVHERLQGGRHAAQLPRRAGCTSRVALGVRREGPAGLESVRRSPRVGRTAKPPSSHPAQPNAPRQAFFGVRDALHERPHVEVVSEERKIPNSVEFVRVVPPRLIRIHTLNLGRTREERSRIFTTPSRRFFLTLMPSEAPMGFI